MVASIKKKTIVIILLALTLFTNATSYAWYDRHYHGGRSYGYNYSYDRNYERGRYYRGRVEPNIIISVPYNNYYLPRCQTVEVCNRFNECWLEPYCS